MAKTDQTSRLYNDLSGYGSMNEMTKDAKEIDETIKFSDVKDWFDNTVRS